MFLFPKVVLEKKAVFDFCPIKALSLTTLYLFTLVKWEYSLIYFLLSGAFLSIMLYSPETAEPLVVAPPMSLARTFSLFLKVCDLYSLQLIGGVQAVIWGILFILPWSQPNKFSPYAYEWMSWLPSFVWGLIWGARGLWQIIAVLVSIRSKEFYFDTPWNLRRIYSERNCYYAAYFAVLFSFFMAFGFLWQLRTLNGFTIYNLFWLCVNAFVFRRLAKVRS